MIFGNFEIEVGFHTTAVYVCRHRVPHTSRSEFRHTHLQLAGRQHPQFDNGRQRVDENGYDQYGNQLDPAMIPDRLDSANVEVQGLPPKLYMWRINNQLGNRTIIPADTAYHHFQNSNLTEGLTGHYNYLANMGSPRMSRIFFGQQ